MTAWVWLAFAAAVTFLALLKPRPIKSRRIQLLRAFFPSWKFFDRPGEMPVLYYRVKPNQSQKEIATYTEWSPVLERATRRWYTPFYNPQGNYLFACQSLLLQLISDLEDFLDPDHTHFEQTPSFQLVKNCVEFELRLKSTKTRTLSSGCLFQFKIVGVSASVSSEGREPNVYSEGREPNVYNEGREPNVYNEGREPSVYNDILVSAEYTLGETSQ